MLTVCGLEQRYLDVDANVNWIFVKQLLAVQKKAFKLSEVRRIELPRYDELSIKVLLDMIHNDQAIRVYLRDDVSEDKPPSRTFLANIINSVYPKYLPHVIKLQTQARHGQAAAAEKGDDIKMTAEFCQALGNAVFADK